MRKDIEKLITPLGWDVSLRGPWPRLTTEELSSISQNEIAFVEYCKNRDKRTRTELAKALAETGGRVIELEK